MQARLFKPFQTSKKEGHGIGLALVKRFVDNFGGSVGVESQLGKGTTFHLKLPLAGTDANVINEPLESLQAPPEPQKIEV
jgi:two-component system sensor histidine kinase FlrB